MRQQPSEEVSDDGVSLQVALSTHLVTTPEALGTPASAGTAVKCDLNGTHNYNLQRSAGIAQSLAFLHVWTAQDCKLHSLVRLLWKTLWTPVRSAVAPASIERVQCVWGAAGPPCLTRLSR